MYIKKRSGQSIEPCGTLHFNCSKFVGFCSLKSSFYSVWKETFKP